MKNFDEYRNFYISDGHGADLEPADPVKEETKTTPKLKTFKEIMLGVLFGESLDSVLPMSTVDYDLKLRLGEWTKENEAPWECDISGEAESAKDAYVMNTSQSQASLDDAYFSDGQKVGEGYSIGENGTLEYTSSDETAPTTAEYIIFRVQAEFPRLEPKTFMEYGLLYFVSYTFNDPLTTNLTKLFQWPVNGDGVPTIAPKTALEWHLFNYLPSLIQDLYSSEDTELSGGDGQVAYMDMDAS